MYSDRPRIPIEKTELDRLVDLISLLAVVLHITYVFLSFKDLPQQIPTHFNGQGVADDWNDKIFIWLLPGISIIMYIGLTILGKYPHKFNYMVKITEENAKRQYRFGVQIIRYLNFSILILFFYVSYMSISMASGEKNAVGSKYLGPVIIVGSVLLTAYVIYYSIKKK